MIELKRTSPHILTYLRESDEAMAYFQSLQYWLCQPNEITISSLTQNLEKYAQKVCKEIEQIENRRSQNIWSSKYSSLSINAIISMVFESVVPIVSSCASLLFQEVTQGMTNYKKFERVRVFTCRKTPDLEKQTTTVNYKTS